jgi:hypothetical protein
MTPAKPAPTDGGRSSRLGAWRAGAAALGLSLLALNAWGWLRPLGSPAVPRQLSAVQVQAQLSELPVDSRGAVRAATQILHQGIVHDWRDERVDDFHLAVPARENFLLWAMRWVHPVHYRKYEFCRADRAIERGVGLCSQYSIALTGVLRQRGIDARILALDGHVVTTAEVEPDVWWVLDADYGVVLPAGVEVLEQDLARVRAAYAAAGLVAEELDTVVASYAPAGNVVWESVFAYCSPQRFAFEYASYVLIWVVPLLLLVPAARLWREGTTEDA